MCRLGYLPWQLAHFGSVVVASVMLDSDPYHGWRALMESRCTDGMPSRPQVCRSSGGVALLALPDENSLCRHAGQCSVSAPLAYVFADWKIPEADPVLDGTVGAWLVVYSCLGQRASSTMLVWRLLLPEPPVCRSGEHSYCFALSRRRAYRRNAPHLGRWCWPLSYLGIACSSMLDDGTFLAGSLFVILRIPAA